VLILNAAVQRVLAVGIGIGVAVGIRLDQESAWICDSISLSRSRVPRSIATPIPIPTNREGISQAIKADKYLGAAEIALAEGMAARGNPPGQDLSSAVPLHVSYPVDPERSP
jgi:hypothetical protein